MKDFLRMRLQPERTYELPPVEKRKQLREAFGLSQKELATQLGVGLSTIYAWESGRNEPRGQARMKYVTFCRTAEEVLKEQEESKNEGESNT
jgi:DNA-binding transcriptional regulator YiaG